MRREILMSHQPDKQGRAACKQGDALGRNRCAAHRLGPVARQDDRRRAATIGGEIEPHGNRIGMIEQRDDKNALAILAGQQRFASAPR